MNEILTSPRALAILRRLLPKWVKEGEISIEKKAEIEAIIKEIEKYNARIAELTQQLEQEECDESN